MHSWVKDTVYVGANNHRIRGGLRSSPPVGDDSFHTLRQTK